MIEFKKVLRFSKGQIGYFPAMVHKKSELADALKQAGFHGVQVLRASEVAARLGVAAEVSDLELFGLDS